MYNILLVDDNPKIQVVVSDMLRYKGYSVTYTASGRDAIQMAAKGHYDALLLDLALIDISGVEVLKRCLADNPTLPVVVFSGESNIVLDAVQAVKLGAYDFLAKPLKTENLLITLKNAIEQHRLKIENEALLDELASGHNLVCESPAMKKIYAQIEKLAAKDVKVLILGETGTGKELVANIIHSLSPRRAKKFVKVNCAAIPQELIESELFGHKKGSFTGAFRDQTGKFVDAHEGTIFLDEIGDLGLAAQAKLLRVLETGEVEIIGSSETLEVDVRVVSATNKNVEHLIETGRFRSDLYYRLNSFTIDIPPLRDRVEDIPVICRLLMRQTSESLNTPLKEIREDAMMALTGYSWPGNVRELRSVTEKLTLLVDDVDIRPTHVFAVLNIESGTKIDREILPLKSAVENFEKSYILRALLSGKRTVSEAAHKLGVERSNLQKKMKRYGISMRELTGKNSSHGG